MSQMSENETLDMYNAVNGTQRRSLSVSADPQRVPQLLTREDGEPIRPRASTIVVEPKTKDEPPARPTLARPKDEGKKPAESSGPKRRTLQSKAK